MKTLIIICAAFGVTVLATYLVVSSQKSAQFERERELMKASWEAERAELESALKAAKRSGATATAVAAAPDSGGSHSSAQEVLERLKKLKVLGGEQRNQSIRHIVHQLENLADLGLEALPAIREFLGKFEDVDYSTEPKGDDKGLAAGGPPGLTPPIPTAGMQSAPRLDAFLPPSLRLGLVQVLREMGGEQAEQILSEMLSTSGRGVEVAYVVRALQEMVPNKYKDMAVAAAKDLLANPPAIDRPNRLDENSKSFLYGVLSMYNDPTFANTAQNQLVTADGRVDRTALNYLTGTLKDDAVPALYQAFKDNRVTNMWERASLASQILNYAGSSSQANDIFKEVVNNEALPSWLRATAIQTVAGGQGPLFGGVSPSDPSTIRARIDLLNSLPEISDERLAHARNDALQKLNDNLLGGSSDPVSGSSFRSRLDRAPGQPEAPAPLPTPGR